MSYDFVTEHTATFYHDRPAGHQYAGIAIHWWGDPAWGPTFDGTIQYLVYGGAKNTASVHYVAEAGRVACLLDPDTQLSWGQGDGSDGFGNNFFLSIECNPRASSADYATVAELIAELRATFGQHLVLRPHRYFTATACPGVWDLARLDALARGTSVAPASTPPAPAPAPAPAPPAAADPNRIHWVVEAGDTLGKIADYYGGPTVAEIAAFNGIPDPNRISVGQAIYIPGPLLWIVDPGDTLGKIAGYYGLTAETVAANNGVDVNATIFPGQVFRILD
jgi:N-acetylmuramoyl-L-alanine amidase